VAGDTLEEANREMTAFPALPGNLPSALTELVGRKQELADAASRLATTRLLTIVGAGGSGKTRLAQAVATFLEGHYQGGAWWVELGPLEGAGLVGQMVAAATRVPQTGGRHPVAAVADHFGGAPALVVLDNCEHLVDECAEVVGGLLRACAGLTVLATSRQPLDVPGEALLRLDGLDYAAGTTAIGRLPDAVELLVERATRADPTFRLQGHEDDAYRLCALLDGLPLAIELAAARVNALTLKEIGDRLDRDERLLRHEGRGVPPRQRTLRSALEWSHQLLRPEEKDLVARLAAFRGTFSLLAAEAVGASPLVPREDVIDVLCRLVDKSLVVATSRGGERRYRLLHSVRRYCEQKLAESGDLDAALDAHAHFYGALAHQAVAGLEGPDQLLWLDRLDVEHDNLRAVLGRQLEAGSDQGGLLAGWLWPFWYRRGYYFEARRWLEMAVAKIDGMSAAAQAGVLTGAGFLAFLQCDYDVARPRLERARDLHQQTGDQLGTAEALSRLGSIAREQGRYGEATALHQESLAIYRGVDHPDGVATSLDYLSFTAWLSGDAEPGCRLAGQAVDHWRAGGRRQETAAALVNLGSATLFAGDPAGAAAILQDALNISRQLRYQEGIAWSTHMLALTRPSEAADQARRELCEALALHQSLGDRWRVASVLEGLGARLVRQDARLACRLLGAAAGIRRRLGTPLPPAEQSDYEQAIEKLRRAMPPSEREREFERGADAAVDELVAEVAQLVGGGPPSAGSWPAAAPGRPAAAGGAGGGVAAGAAGDGMGGGGMAGGGGPTQRPLPELTDRELAVLRLLSQGSSNREIARKLFISPSTAGVHVSNILRKLGVSSRVQAAGVAHQAGVWGEEQLVAD
jgi:predicted ATPase/DNA-binding CsgD family transcriptional regulator